jgi:hypothetical protein
MTPVSNSLLTMNVNIYRAVLLALRSTSKCPVTFSEIIFSYTKFLVLFFYFMYIKIPPPKKLIHG